MTRIATTAAVLALLILLTACARAADGPPSTPDDEVRRIQDHLGRVLVELRDRPVDDLTEDQKQARSETLTWLAEYRATGEFPHNHFVEGRRTPVFVDPHGTPCAVGYLLLRSGWTELVAEIVRRDNLVRVPDLAGHAGLEGWLEERGLTLDEAARIQPSYGPPPDDDEPHPSDSYRNLTVGVSAVTAVASTLSLFTDVDPEKAPWLESVSVAATMGHLGLALTGEDEPTGTRNVNVLGAVLAAVVFVDRLHRRSASRLRGDGISAIPFVENRPDRVLVGVSVVH